MNELARQFLHMIFGAVLLLLAGLFGRDFTLSFLFVCFFLGLVLVNAKLSGFQDRMIDGMLTAFDRREKIPGRGALAFAAGALFLYAATPLAFAMGITAILAFGDGFSTVIGITGKSKLPFNKQKTWEGMAAFIIAGIASSMLFLGLENAILYSVLLAVVEAIDLKADDNVLIPFAAVLLKTILE